MHERVSILESGAKSLIHDPSDLLRHWIHDTILVAIAVFLVALVLSAFRPLSVDMILRCGLGDG